MLFFSVAPFRDELSFERVGNSNVLSPWIFRRRRRARWQKLPTPAKCVCDATELDDEAEKERERCRMPVRWVAERQGSVESIVYFSELLERWHDWSTTVTGSDRVVTDVSNDDVWRSRMTTVSDCPLAQCPCRKHRGWIQCSPSTDCSGRDRSRSWHSFQRVASRSAVVSIVTLLSPYLFTVPLPCLPFVVAYSAPAAPRWSLVRRVLRCPLTRRKCALNIALLQCPATAAKNDGSRLRANGHLLKVDR